jgi:hypothetical protein
MEIKVGFEVLEGVRSLKAAETAALQNASRDSFE